MPYYIGDLRNIPKVPWFRSLKVMQGLYHQQYPHEMEAAWESFFVSL